MIIIINKVYIKNTQAAQKLNLHPKADGQIGSIGAPMPGEILSLSVRTGDTVKKGQTLATIR